MKDPVKFLKNIPKALIKQGEGSKDSPDIHKKNLDDDEIPMAIIRQGGHSSSIHKNKIPIKEGLDAESSGMDSLYSRLRKEHGYFDLSLHKSLGNHYRFNPDELRHITSYTDDSEVLNSHIFNQAKDNQSGPNLVFLKKKNYDLPGIDATLGNKPAPHDLHVYSGVKFNPADVRNKDNLIHLPAYTSTSLYQHVAVPFAEGLADHEPNDVETTHHHILRIHIPVGSEHGAYIAHHSPFDEDITLEDGSKKPTEHGEREFLMKRGAIIRVDPAPFDQHIGRFTDTHSGKDYHISKYHLWNAHIVGHKNYD